MALNQQRDLYPERLAQARLIRGKTRQELADVFEITRQAVSQYENGTCNPKPEILRQYQEYLDMPINFFYTAPIDKTGTAINFRKLQKSTDIEQGRTAVRLEFMTEVYLYFKKFMEFPKVNIPYRNECDHYSDAEIEAIVAQVRKEWKLGHLPIKNVALLMENLGCILSKFKSQGKVDIDGCSKPFYVDGETRPCVAMISGGEPSACRERFSLAHELGHLILHSWVDADYTKDKNDLKRKEHEANYFAGAFLLPFEEFSREAMSCSAIDSFIALKSRWKVSIAAMIKRAQAISIISDNQAKYLYTQINIRRIKKNEPLDDVIPHDEPQNMYNALSLLTENEIRSGDEILEELPLPMEEFAQICGVDCNPDLFFAPRNKPSLRLI